MAVLTPEVSIDLTRFQRLVSGAIAASDTIASLYRHRVESVERTAEGFRVTGSTPEGDPWQRCADVVVNCLWDGRLAIDGQMAGLMAIDKNW